MERNRKSDHGSSRTVAPIDEEEEEKGGGERGGRGFNYVNFVKHFIRRFILMFTVDPILGQLKPVCGSTRKLRNIRIVE
jgi:hypothetical protein